MIKNKEVRELLVKVPDPFLRHDIEKKFEELERMAELEKMAEAHRKTKRGKVKEREE